MSGEQARFRITVKYRISGRKGTYHTKAPPKKPSFKLTSPRLCISNECHLITRIGMSEHGSFSSFLQVLKCDVLCHHPSSLVYDIVKKQKATEIGIHQKGLSPVLSTASWLEEENFTKLV